MLFGTSSFFGYGYYSMPLKQIPLKRAIFSKTSLYSFLH